MGTFTELYKVKSAPWDPTYYKHHNKLTNYGDWEELSKAVGYWNNPADCVFQKFESVQQAGERIARRKKKTAV
jgi:hypothetical protein